MKMNRQKKHDWIPITTAILSFVFGIIGGKALDTLISPLFNTDTKAIVTILFIVGLFVVISMIMVAIFSARAERREEAWLNSFGTPAELVFERGEAYKGEYYHRLIGFLERTSIGDEILIMSQHRLNDKASEVEETEARKRAREAYSALLLEKARQQGITYRRIVCFEEGTSKGEIKPERVKEWLVDHCREMLEIKRSKPDKISLKKSKTKISADIFIIRGKVGTIVVDIYDSHDGSTHKNGATIFHSPPNREIIDQLHDWFMEIDGEEGTVTVTQIPVAKDGA
jgi:hypothetical protein